MHRLIGLQASFEMAKEDPITAETAIFLNFFAIIVCAWGSPAHRWRDGFSN